MSEYIELEGAKAEVTYFTQSEECTGRVLVKLMANGTEWASFSMLPHQAQQFAIDLLNKAAWARS